MEAKRREAAGAAITSVHMKKYAAGLRRLLYLYAMEYQVPQFIEVEDKIFGPFTLKQFIYVAGGVGLCVILILYFPLIIGIILALPVAALTAALAFYTIFSSTVIDQLMLEVALLCIPFAPRGFRPGLGADSPPFNTAPK